MIEIAFRRREQANKMKDILFYVSCVVLYLEGAMSSRAKCRRPNGVEGDVKLNGCEELTCTAISAKKGIWISGPAM